MASDMRESLQVYIKKQHNESKYHDLEADKKIYLKHYEKKAFMLFLNTFEELEFNNRASIATEAINELQSLNQQMHSEKPGALLNAELNARCTITATEMKLFFAMQTLQLTSLAYTSRASLISQIQIENLTHLEACSREIINTDFLQKYQNTFFSAYERLTYDSLSDDESTPEKLPSDESSDSISSQETFTPKSNDSFVALSAPNMSKF